MKVGISMDFDSEAKIESVIFPLQDAVRLFFDPKQYGPGLGEVFIIFNCRSGAPLKQRKRFDKNDKVLMYDIISNFELISSVQGQEKKDIILGLFRDSVSAIMPYKKKISEFDFEKFEKDWYIFFENYS